MKSVTFMFGIFLAAILIGFFEFDITKEEYMKGIKNETITFSIKRKDKKKLVAMAESEERTLSALVRMILKKHLESTK